MLSILHDGFMLLLLIHFVTVQGKSIEFNSSDKKDICGTNEQYKCGKFCVETCNNNQEICSANIKCDCFCMNGYVRQSNEPENPCIKQEDCKNQTIILSCSDNEEYKQCGSSCSPKCSDLFYSQQPKMCTSSCNSGCFCIEGYYRSKDGQCVQPQECCTSKNENYTDCGTACPETCDFSPQICTRQCVRGCFCKSSNYVRKDNSTNSSCIKRDQC